MLLTLGFLLISAYMVSDVQTSRLNLTVSRKGRNPYDVHVALPHLTCNQTHELIVSEADIGTSFYALFDSTMVSGPQLTIREVTPNIEVEVELRDFCEPMQIYWNSITTGALDATPDDRHFNLEYRKMRLTAQPTEEGTILATATIPQGFLKCDGDIAFSVRYSQLATDRNPNPAVFAYVQNKHTSGPIQMVLQPWAEYFINVGVWCRSAVTILFGLVEASPGKLPQPEVAVIPSLYTVRAFIASMEKSDHEYEVNVCPSPDIGVGNCSVAETEYHGNVVSVTVGHLLSDTGYKLTVTGFKYFNGKIYYSDPFDIEFRTLDCGPTCSGLPAIKNVTIRPNPASARFVIEYHEEKLDVRFRVEVCPIKNASCMRVFAVSQGNVTVIKLRGLKPRTRYNATVTPERLHHGVKKGPANSQLFTTRDCSKDCAGVWGNLSLELIHQPNYADILVGLPEEAPCKNPTYEIRCRNETIRLNGLQVANKSVTLRNFPYWKSRQRVVLKVSCGNVQRQIYVGRIDTGPGRLNVISNIQVTRKDVQLTVNITCQDNLKVYPGRYRIDLCVTLQGICNRTRTDYTGQTTTFKFTKVNPKGEYTISVIPEFHYKENWIAGDKVTREIKNAALRSLDKLLDVFLMPPDEDGNAGMRVSFPASRCGVDHYKGYFYVAERVPDEPSFHHIVSNKNEFVYAALECWTSYNIRIYCPAQEGYVTQGIYTGPGPLRRPRYMEISVTDTSAEIQINHRFYNASYPVEFEIQLCEAHVWVCNRTIIARTGRVTVLKYNNLIPESTYLIAAVPRLIFKQVVYLGHPLHTEFLTDRCSGLTGCSTFHPLLLEARTFSVVVHVKWSDRVGESVSITLNSTNPGIYRSRTIFLQNQKATPTIDDLLPGVEYVVFVTPLHAMSPGAPDISGKVTTLECRFDCKDRSNRPLPLVRKDYVDGRVVYLYQLFKGQKCTNKTYVAATNVDGRPETTNFRSRSQDVFFSAKFMVFTPYEVKILTWCDGKRFYFYDAIFEDFEDVPPVKNMSVTPGDTYAVVQFLHDRYAPPVRYEINYCLQKKSDCQTKRIAPFSTDVYVNVTELVPDTEYSVFVKTLIITGTGYVDGPRTPTVLFSTKPCHVNCPEPHEVVVMPINHEAVKVDIYTHSASRKNPVYLNVSWCDVGMQSCAFKNENVTTRNAVMTIHAFTS